MNSITKNYKMLLYKIINGYGLGEGLGARKQNFGNLR